ncbi:DNA-dependent metalloprotease WSS1 homolog 2 [Linum perenne]
MQEGDSMIGVPVTWRGKRYEVEIEGGACLKDLGDELQKLTDVEADTMRLIVPQGKSSKLVYPFSVEHSHLTLLEASIAEGKPIRMMGVFKDEVDRILENAKVDMRIAGFDEEGRRMRQRTSVGRPSLPKLPGGSYIFCDFRTLSIPGIELNPPPSEALKRMHMLAADPGIIAIMNKHRWRVGIMTEMAPIGYVGVSPKCILGFNKNQGEEISLRLRTDDLKGFRKYESIKKTLLHELAHMVFSEHDADFYALDKQLNQEAATLDWTKAKGHTLSGVSNSAHYEDDFDDSNYVIASQKLGGNVSDQLESARASSVAAAYRRLANVSEEPSEMDEEPDPDDSNGIENAHGIGSVIIDEPDPDDNVHNDEPDPDDSLGNQEKGCEPTKASSEPDPDDLEESVKMKNEADFGQTDREPDLIQPNGVAAEPDPDDSGLLSQIAEPVPDDEELRRIQDPVTAICSRISKAIQSLRAEANSPLEASAALQTLSKVIRNAIEHPNEAKFRKLRKGNPVIRKNIASHKAAMEILQVAGFIEETVLDERGNPETYLTLKRNDPGLLWLAKSSLEASS